jgi:hypothetical protein
MYSGSEPDGYMIYVMEGRKERGRVRVSSEVFTHAVQRMLDSPWPSGTTAEDVVSAIERCAKQDEIDRSNDLFPWRVVRIEKENNVKAVICPVCNGRGTVGAGFYTGGLSSDAANQTCRSCDGRGYLTIVEK